MAIPKVLDRHAVKERGEEHGNEPGDDKGHGRVAGDAEIAEGVEEAEVEADEGEFDEGLAGEVEDLVGDEGLVVGWSC